MNIKLWTETIDLFSKIPCADLHVELLYGSLSMAQRRQFPKSYKVPKVLDPNHVILTLNNGSGDMVAFIHVVQGEYNRGSALFFNYAWTRESHRRHGLSIFLRLLTITYAESAKISYIVSVPLDGAHSSPLLKKLQFSPGEGDSVYLDLKGIAMPDYVISHLQKMGLCTH